jgi:hypothetical protein
MPAMALIQEIGPAPAMTDTGLALLQQQRGLVLQQVRVRDLVLQQVSAVDVAQQVAPLVAPRLHALQRRRGVGPPVMRSIKTDQEENGPGDLLAEIRSVGGYCSLAKFVKPGMSPEVKSVLDSLTTMTAPSSGIHLCEIFNNPDLHGLIMTGSLVYIH